METKNVDLSSLRIDRSPQPPGLTRRRPFFRKKILWTIALVGAAAGALLIRQWFTPAVQIQLAPAVLTSPAQAYAVLTASGYVVARRKAAVASKGTGTLVFLGVEEGDRVTKGQLIARLDDSDVMATLERNRENLRLAEADLHEARRSFERMKTLLQKGFVAQADYDTAEARYNRVVAVINSARFAVKEAQVAVDNTRIIAPFDGTVLKKNADVGEIVAPLAGAASSKAAVVTIADMTSLEVEADVSEANMTRVTTRQDCEIALDAYPQHRYPGYVSKIVPTADRAKATVLVKIQFNSYDQRVLPEMSAKITFLGPGAGHAVGSKPVLTVPSTAVASRDGRAVTYQMRDGHAVEVPVVTGAPLGSQTEIKQGLNEGDKVVARVDDRIQPGVKLSVATK